MRSTPVIIFLLCLVRSQTCILGWSVTTQGSSIGTVRSIVLFIKCYLSFVEDLFLRQSLPLRHLRRQLITDVRYFMLIGFLVTVFLFIKFMFTPRSVYVYRLVTDRLFYFQQVLWVFAARGCRVPSI